ncbi:MAG: hypothetical protein Ct9H300mP23_01340 [Nitrospinota bacterium]|nr:MAG: hypothetical protein Ct9H300mP23_01340 [Nitrospinota bacterium]
MIKKRKQEFEKKFLLSRILQKLIYNQFFCDKVVKILRDKRDLAETLVGVMGGFGACGEGGFI